MTDLMGPAPDAEKNLLVWYEYESDKGVYVPRKLYEWMNSFTDPELRNDALGWLKLMAKRPPKEVETTIKEYTSGILKFLTLESIPEYMNASLKADGTFDFTPIINLLEETLNQTKYYIVVNVDYRKIWTYFLPYVHAYVDVACILYTLQKEKWDVYVYMITTPGAVEWLRQLTLHVRNYYHMEGPYMMQWVEVERAFVKLNNLLLEKALVKKGRFMRRQAGQGGRLGPS